MNMLKSFPVKFTMKHGKDAFYHRDGNLMIITGWIEDLPIKVNVENLLPIPFEMCKSVGSWWKYSIVNSCSFQAEIPIEDWTNIELVEEKKVMKKEDLKVGMIVKNVGLNDRKITAIGVNHYLYMQPNSIEFWDDLCLINTWEPVKEKRKIIHYNHIWEFTNDKGNKHTGESGFQYRDWNIYNEGLSVEKYKLLKTEIKEIEV